MWKNIFLSAMLFLMAMLPCVAMATEAVAYTINLKDGLEGIIGLIFAVMGALAGSVITLLFGRSNSKIKLDSETRTYLDMAIQGALVAAEAKLRDKVKDINDPVVKSQLVAIALNTLLGNIPLLIQKLGYTNSEIAALISAKIGVPANESAQLS